MDSFICSHCGASLTIPKDPNAFDAECIFCDRRTLLPPSVIAARRPPPQMVQMPMPFRPLPPPPMPLPQVPDTTTADTYRVLGIAGVVACGLLGLGAAFFTKTCEATSNSKPPEAQPVTPVSVPDPTPSEPPEPPHPISTGATQANELLMGLRAQGCKDIILEPTQSSGTQTIETKFVLNGTCVTMGAVSGAPENMLTLQMKTPLGKSLDTPAPRSEVQFTICPQVKGTYPTTIVPTTDDPYTVFAVECPAAKKAKNAVHR
ncbi:MAG: hypothetical protein FWD69_17750 [Polyangiaceae bacterium]|nr:hypothetical protein [Polyangiaceae bacterium]